MKKLNHTPYLLGVDVGGTKIAAAVADAVTGSVLGEIVAPSSRQGGEQLLTAIEVAAALARARAGVQGPPVGVGLGIPGHVNPDEGLVHLAVNLALADYPLGRRLASRLAAPVALENDVRLAALGVYQRLARQGEGPQGEGPRRLAYVGLGTGIAVGLVFEGQIERGENGLAGEIGHMIVEPGGALCHCGLRGCLETVAAGPAIAGAGQQQLEGVQSTADVYQAAAAGEPAAQQIVRRAARFLAQALYGLLVTTDVEAVVLGGGVTSAGDAFFEPLLAELAALADRSALAATLLAPGRFTLLPPGLYPGTWGALVLAGAATGSNQSLVPCGGRMS